MIFDILTSTVWRQKRNEGSGKVWCETKVPSHSVIRMPQKNLICCCLYFFISYYFVYQGGDSDLKAQEPQDLRPLLMSHGLHECKECDQVFPDAQR